MEVRQVRYAEIKLIKIDEPEVNIRYTGRSDSMRAADSDPVWQILREYRVGDTTISTYALMGEFKCKWTDRAGYFSAATPDPNSPLGGTIAVSGTFSPSGLRVAGKISVVTLNAVTWTALPAVPLVDRNGISIHNQTATQLKVNYDPSEPGYIGPWINANGERYYDIKDSIVIYGKCASGTVDVIIEELS